MSDRLLPVTGAPREPASIARRALQRMRVVGLVEGTSFVLLLGVAMPLKYLAGMPQAVKVTGWVHGVLFLWLLAELYETARVRRWPLARIALVFAAAVVPFGTFALEPSLRREQRSVERA